MEEASGWHNFLEILTKPDNIPIVAMLILVIFFTWLGLREALKNDKLDEAMAAFTRGLAIDQFSDLLHYYLAMTYEKKDMVFHAIYHYEKAIELNPGFYDAITSLANLYQKQEFWRKAVEMWELALSATKYETVRARIKDHLLSLL